MITEQLAAFRDAVHWLKELKKYVPSAPVPGVKTPVLEYMRAIRRAQAAFGIPFNSDNYQRKKGDDAIWARLHAAIFRWGEITQ